MRKLSFFFLAFSIFCTLSGPSSAQVWNIVYGGDYIPTLPPGVGQQLQAKDVVNPFDWTQWSGGGALVPTGSPGFIHLYDNVAASGQKWDEAEDATTGLDTSFPLGGTLVTRLRRPAGAVGVGDVDSFVIQNQGQAVGIRIGEGNGISFNDGSGVVIPAGSLTNGLDGWHVFRFTWAPESGVLRVNTYVDGVATPVDSHLTNRTGPQTWKLGSSSNGTGEYYLDWLLVTDDGAFAPGTGPAMPAGGYVENSPGAPVATFTPGPPTATPQPTSTPTPCAVGELCNGGFDSGSLTPWIAAGPSTIGLSGPVGFCSISPYTGGFMNIHVVSGGEATGAYYQQVASYPHSQALLSCRFAADCNPGHTEYGRIGIDPNGGTNVNAPSIVWSGNLDAAGGNIWELKSVGPVNVTPNSTITVWFEHNHTVPSTDGWNITAFDDFSLAPSLTTPTPTPEPTVIQSNLQRNMWDPYK